MRLYPTVMTEMETLDAVLSGRSLSRFGDGEFRLAVGGKAVSQKADPKLALELRNLLWTRKTASLVCIPRLESTPPERRPNWERYTTELKYVELLHPKKKFGSSFVTRPDNAPAIATEDYWSKVRSLWLGRDVTLVTGSDRSVTTEMMGNSPTSVRVVRGTYHDSYDVVAQIEEEIGTPSGIVILCIGATATVLAERLAKKKVWAVDLGHAGMFLRRWDNGQAA